MPPCDRARNVVIRVLTLVSILVLVDAALRHRYSVYSIRYLMFQSLF